MPDPTSPIATPRILVSPPSDANHAHLGWPKLTVTSKGRHILAYAAGRTHTIGGSPAVSVSEDGVEFSDPTILRVFSEGDDYPHCGNLAIGTTADDVVILLAMGHRGNETNTIFGWASVGGGENWQEINVAALSAGRTGSVYGHVFHVPGRGYAVCGHYRQGSYPHDVGLWICFSQDGLHWAAPEHVTDEALVEPAVIPTDEAIVGLIRHTDPGLTSGYASLRASRRRMDWEVSQSPVRSASGARSTSPFIVRERESDRLFALLTERKSEGNTPGRISLWVSTDDGQAWTDRGTLVDFPAGDTNTDFGYPWMAQREDGSWLMAFYSGERDGPNAIWGFEFQTD